MQCDRSPAACTQVSSVTVTEDSYPGSEATGIQTMFRVTFNVVTEKVTFTLAACPSVTWKVSSDMHHIKRLMAQENEYLNSFPTVGHVYKILRGVITF